MPPASERLAEFTTALAYDDIPADVAEAAKLHLLDTLGCGLAAHAVGVGGAGRATMAELGGEGESTVIGAETGMPAANAAFANAMLCHALDFDDTHGGAVAHVSVVVSPAAVAVGEARGADGRELVAAIVGGNEVVTRVGGAASGAFHARGFHPTAIAGIFGGVTAAARLSSLPVERTVSALGVAGSMASGLFAYLEDGTDTKPIHPAWAAHGAIVAARLASFGAEGPPHVLEGRFGLYDAFVGMRDTVDLEAALGDLGSRWETPRIAYKPYPACHYIHGSLGATRTLVGLDPAEVEDVVVTIPQAGVALVLEPVASKLAPRTPYEAKFSLQYSTAAMLVHGQVGVASYTDAAIADPKVLELARKVRYEVKEYPGSEGGFPGGVRVTLRDGRVLDADLPHQLGGPENPMSGDEVREKFRGNASLALADDEVERLERDVLAIEEHADLRAAFAPLAARRAVTA
jgi:2-methylcitrate dehydratase PrpD